MKNATTNRTDTMRTGVKRGRRIRINKSRLKRQNFENGLLKYAPMDMEKSGKWLRFLCRLNGYTVGEVCRLVGVSCPQSVYAWFKGKTMPSLDHLYGLSRLLQCSIDELVLGEDETLPRGIVERGNERELRMLRYYYRQLG